MAEDYGLGPGGGGVRDHAVLRLVILLRIRAYYAQGATLFRCGCLGPSEDGQPELRLCGLCRKGHGMLPELGARPQPAQQGAKRMQQSARLLLLMVAPPLSSASLISTQVPTSGSLVMCRP